MPPDHLAHLARCVEVERALDRHEDVQAGLAGGFHDCAQPHAREQFAQVECDFLAFFEGDRVQLGLFAGRFLAGIDIGVDVEDDVVGVIEDGSFERGERARVVGPLVRRIRARFRPGMPHVKLEGARLREPQQRRQVVAQQVVVALVFVLGENGDRLGEPGKIVIPVFLEKALPADALGHADHGERPVGEMRKHEG